MGSRHTHTDDDIRQLEEALNNMLIYKGDYKNTRADYEFPSGDCRGIAQQRVLQRDELD